jgi:hypothetical protein
MNKTAQTSVLITCNGKTCKNGLMAPYNRQVNLTEAIKKQHKE